MTNKYQLKRCMMNKCSIFCRHYRDRAVDQRKNYEKKDRDDINEMERKLGLLEDCDTTKLVQICVTNEQFGNEVGMKNVCFITSYINGKRLTGKDIMKMKREEFADAAVRFCNADKYRDVALKLYDIFTKSLFPSYNNRGEELLFYKDLMDGIHCFLYHLEDVGLRECDIRYDTNKFDLFTRSNVSGMNI